MGLDVDVMKEFCKLTGMKLKLVESPVFDGIWFDPIYDKADVAIGGIGITQNRTAPGMSWSIPYFYVSRTLVYNKRLHPIRRVPEDITGPIRATEGSTGLYDAARWEQMMDVLEPGKTDEEDIQDLLQGKVQGLMRGSFVGSALVRKYKQLGMVKPWKIDPSLVSSDGEVFAYPTRCASGVGQLLSVLITEEIFTGELQHLIKKYKLT